MNAFRPLAASLVLTVLTASAGATPSVLVVDLLGGPGTDFQQIQDAVDAAAEGDTILVRGGLYDAVTISGKSLVVVADTKALVQIMPLGTNGLLPALTVDDLGAGQSVTIRGIELDQPPGNSASTLVSLDDDAGTVWMESCSGVPDEFLDTAQTSLTARNCGNLVLVRCSFVASPVFSGLPVPGVSTTGSNVTLYDTSVLGSLGTAMLGPAQDGGSGLIVDGGTLFASGCTLSGGSGAAGVLGEDGGNGGDGLVLSANNPVVRLLDTDLVGGAGGAGGSNGGLPGADGLPLVVTSGSATTISGEARSFAIASPVRAGVEDLDETYTGQPGDVVVAAYSLVGPLRGTFLGILKGNLVIAPPFVSVVVGTIDDSGQLLVQPPTMPLAGGVEALTLYLQGAMVSSTGEGLFLSAPTSLSLLGSSF